MGLAFLSCNCPKCQHQTLFKGYLKFHSKCSHCGLDFSKGDIADGPAYVVMCIVMTLIMILVVMVEYWLAPPYWVHGVLWLPLTFILSMVLLRYTRSFFLYTQFETRREQFEDQTSHSES